MKRRLLVLLGLLAFFAALPGRIILPPMDRDEARYMQATRQMLESGDLIQIKFQDSPRNHQPGGIYWLEATSIKLTSLFCNKAESRPWVYRIPSLLASVLCILLTAAIGSLLFRPAAGGTGALFLLASILFSVESRLATIDTALLAAILGCMTVLASSCRKIYQERLSPENYPLPLAGLYWLSLGAGLLLKGPIILLTALVGPLCLCCWKKDWRIFKSLRFQWGWLIPFAMVAPWLWLTETRTHGEFLRYAVGHNLLGKIGHAQESHGFPPGYYTALFLISFWPASFLAVRAIPSIWKARSQWQIQFLLCWLIPYWLIFAFLRTKLPHYILPVYPAVALLTATSILSEPFPIDPTLLSSIKNGPRPFLLLKTRLWKGFTALYGFLWGLLSIALACTGPALLLYLHRNFSFPALFFASSGLGLLLLGGFFFKQKENLYGTVSLALAGLTLESGLYFFLLPKLPPLAFPRQVAAFVTAHTQCPDAILYSPSYREPSVVFLNGGMRVKLAAPEEAGEKLAGRTDPCAMALLDQKDIPAFLQSGKKRRNIPKKSGEIRGLNYSTGRMLTLSLYGFPPPENFGLPAQPVLKDSDLSVRKLFP